MFDTQPFIFRRVNTFFRDATLRSVPALESYLVRVIVSSFWEFVRSVSLPKPISTFDVVLQRKE